MANIREVALEANVSVTTVSHVLNKTRYVHPETEARILSAIKKLNYRPNRVARSLRKRQTKTIGLIVSDIDTAFFPEMTRAIEKVARDQDYSVILCNADESLEIEQNYVNLLFEKQVDGIILSPNAGNHEYLLQYLKRECRIVFINRFIEDISCPAVINNDEESVFQITNMLLEKNHRHLGIAIWQDGISTTTQRFNGFKYALEMSGIDTSEAWVYTGHAKHNEGYLAASSLAISENPPSAIIAFNTLMQDGILIGLQDLAPNLLKNIEITGVGYSPIARAFRSSTMFIDQDPKEIGIRAANLLLENLEGKRVWDSNERIIVLAKIKKYIKEGSE
jgi:LacI family transcriptional regulator